MNVDGYFTIVHPVFHRTKITKGRLFKCLIVLWLLAGAIVVSFLFSRGDMHYRQIFISCNAALYGYACFYLRQDLLYKQEIFYKLSKDVQKKCCISSRQRCFAFGKKTTCSQLKARQILLYCSGLLLYLFPAFDSLNATHLKKHNQVNVLIHPWLITLN